MIKYSTEYLFEDEDGINPTGLPMDLSFELDYTFMPGCPARIRYDENDHPEEPPEIEIYECICNTENVPKEVNEWFLKYIHADSDLINRIYEQISDEMDERNYNRGYDD
jgi:hypothetical protein